MLTITDPTDAATLRATIVDVVAQALTALQGACVDDAARVDRIRAVDRAVAALAASQVCDSTEFYTSQLDEQEQLGVPARRRGRGIADQLGLATKRSPVVASRRLADARVLMTDMPMTLAALAAGRVSELGASIAVRETACLGVDDRRQIDRELAAMVEGMSIGQIEQATRRRVQELDVEAAVKRTARAHQDRHVSIRPQADCMARVSALVPAEQGVAVYAALRAAAASAQATGDERTRGQVMADTLVERVTGQSFAALVPLEIGVVMTADALLGRSETPAQLVGYGPIPAALGRQLACAAAAADADARLTGTSPDGGEGRGATGVGADDVTDVTNAGKARAWVRRLLTDPVDGTVTGMDSRRRRFSGALATFVRLRDQVCRDPYCDAPIRDLDHLHDYADGGTTRAENGIGLCRRGNLVDQVPGWRITGTGRQRVIVTPTGHRYESRPPPALGPSLTSQRPATHQEARAG
jgi:hypothetical protein